MVLPVILEKIVLMVEMLIPFRVEYTIFLETNVDINPCVVLVV